MRNSTDLFGNNMKKQILLIIFIVFFLSLSPKTFAAISDGDDEGGTYVKDLIQIIFGSVDTNSIPPIDRGPSVPTPTTNPANPPANETIVSLDEFFDTTNISYPENLNSMISKCLTFRSTYEQAGAQTGVPWQVLAGIHFREGSCGSGVSLVSGRPIGGLEPDVPRGSCSSQQRGPGIPIPVAGGCGFPTFLDTAIYAGNHLKGKIGKTPQTFAELTMALSRYNGGGNSNCGKTPYQSCPKLHYGEDDTYVMNLFDARHTPMYIVYCADYTLCNPAVKDSRPGTATAARIAAGLTQ